MAINENRLKEVFHGIRMALGSVLNLSEQEMKSAAQAIEAVFSDTEESK